MKEPDVEMFVDGDWEPAEFTGEYPPVITARHVRTWTKLLDGLEVPSVEGPPVRLRRSHRWARRP